MDDQSNHNLRTILAILYTLTFIIILMAIWASSIFERRLHNQQNRIDDLERRLSAADSPRQSLQRGLSASDRQRLAAWSAWPREQATGQARVAHTPPAATPTTAMADGTPNSVSPLRQRIRHHEPASKAPNGTHPPAEDVA